MMPPDADGTGDAIPDATALIRELVAIPGPPGQEEAVREAVRRHVHALGYDSGVDAKGNLLVPVPGGDPGRQARIVVTAHLDEIALLVAQVEPDGALRVVPLGGLYPWKWGEQPVSILARGGALPGVICFGSIHTSSPAAIVNQQARPAAVAWDNAWVFTGLPPSSLMLHGVRPGVRVVLAPERRTVLEFGPFLASYFLDDRADLAAWLLALAALRDISLPEPVLFAATSSEEMGGEGAAWMLQRAAPEVCIALEIGPSVPESRFLPGPSPTIWANDSYAPMAARDAHLLEDVMSHLGLRPHWQALSRGGSDASCAAQRGLTARPITLGLPVENSHGFEIMHRDAPSELARVLIELVKRITM